MDTIGTQLAVLYTVSIENTIGTQLAVLYTVSIEDTIGTQLAVLCRKVSLTQRYRFVHRSMWLGLQAVSSLERGPFIQSVLYREVPRYSIECVLVLVA